jgi:hypothetical protein
LLRRRGSPPEHGQDDQRERDRRGRRELVDEEEQQVEGKREHGAQSGAAQLSRSAPRERQQRAERTGDEQVAKADHRGAELGALQARQGRRR